jgi:uncharacterized membrane protein YccC
VKNEHHRKMNSPPINLRSAELAELKKEINDREEIIAAHKSRTFEAMTQWLAEAALQGQALNRVRAALGHGRWLQWVAVNCPFAHDTASRYIQAAANFAAERNLNPHLTMLEIAANLIRRRQENKEPERVTPAYLMALDRVSKLCGYLERQRPKDASELLGWMPEEGKQKLREDLAPVARELWPGRIG